MGWSASFAGKTNTGSARGTPLRKSSPKREHERQAPSACARLLPQLVITTLPWEEELGSGISPRTRSGGRQQSMPPAVPGLAECVVPPLRKDTDYRKESACWTRLSGEWTIYCHRQRSGADLVAIWAC